MNIFSDDMGKRTNDPKYYYFKNEDFKVAWSPKYVKLYIIIGRANVSKIMFTHSNRQLLKLEYV